MENCFDAQYCHHLPQMVYPTPFYETLMALTLFAILWMIRKKLPYAGLLFGIYLVFNGFERYLIEQIRVNSVINVLGFSMHQAEIIAMLMALLGLILIVFAYKRKTPMQLTPQV
jgi:prolipoprotein diacylglyceryltransferase